MDALTRSIHGRCDGIRRRLDEQIEAATSEGGDRCADPPCKLELVAQVEHAAAVDVPATRPFSWDLRARAYAAGQDELPPPAADQDLLA